MRCLTLADNKVASAFAPPARQDGSAADNDSQRFDSECFWKFRSGLAQTVANHFSWEKDMSDWLHSLPVLWMAILSDV